MKDDAAPCPGLGLAIEAAHETKVASSQEAEALQDAICNAVRAYSDFLERHGPIWGYGHPDDPLRLKAQALVVTLDYGDGNNAIDITLKDGALHRLYGDGVDPDPY
jgi:hypothetical protein